MHRAQGRQAHQPSSPFYHSIYCQPQSKILARQHAIDEKGVIDIEKEHRWYYATWCIRAEGWRLTDIIERVMALKGSPHAVAARKNTLSLSLARAMRRQCLRWYISRLLLIYRRKPNAGIMLKERVRQFDACRMLAYYMSPRRPLPSLKRKRRHIPSQCILQYTSSRQVTFTADNDFMWQMRRYAAAAKFPPFILILPYLVEVECWHGW